MSAGLQRFLFNMRKNKESSKKKNTHTQIYSLVDQSIKCPNRQGLSLGL